MKQHYKELLLIALILFGGLFARLYRFNNPIADWHSWRQADTSAVSRNFIKYGFDLLHPRMNNISNVQSGLENPQGYFYTEFPLYNTAQAELYKTFGVLTIEEWGRIITIFMSLLGSVFLFFLVKRRGYAIEAWFVLLFSVFIPYNIYYGRTILPDSSMVAAALGGIFFLDKWLDGFRKKGAKPQLVFLFFSLLFTIVSFLLKPYAIFYAVPMVVLTFVVLKWNMFKKWQLWVFAVLSVLPLLWWRNYMRTYPEGIPANAWLLNGNGIRFRPAFFRWIFYERITKLISGYAGVLFLVLGIPQLLENKKDIWFFLSFPFAALLYLCIFATGNVQHDYYQIVIMPSVAILCGFGAQFAISFLRKYLQAYIAYAIVGVVILTGFYFGWMQVKDYFNINNPSIVVAGKAVDRLIPKNAKIIAPYGGDSSFLYQTNRQGWASFDFDLPKLISLGADYLVLVNPTVQDLSFGNTYKMVSKAPEYVLYDLRQKP